MKRVAVNADLARNREFRSWVSFPAMKPLNPHRSALTAIAAVLVFGSTPAFTQNMPSGSDAGAQAPAAETSAAPVVAPEIVTPGGQPAQASTLPTTNGGLTPLTVAPPVAQTPNVPQTPLVTAPVEEAAPAPRATETRSRPVAAATPKVESAPSHIAAPQPAGLQAATADAPTEPLPGLAPSELMAMEQGEAATPAPVVQEAPIVENDRNMGAIIGGAGAVLLLGGAAYALSRRRKVGDRDALVTPSYEPRSAPLDAVPTTVVTRGGSAPIATVASPMNVRTQVARTAAATAIVSNDLEAMAAAAPTADNPFLTRKNRLRRANFLLHRGRGNHSNPAAMAARTPEMAYQSQSQRSAQPVYDFGRKPLTFRPVGWKPSTT